MKNGNFIPTWGVNDHQMCCVKFVLLQMWSCTTMVVGLVHNCNLYVYKDMVLKHTPAKFD